MLACHYEVDERPNQVVLWPIKTGEYCPEKDLVNGDVRFGKKVKKDTYDGINFFRANSCSKRITDIISVVDQFCQNYSFPPAKLPRARSTH